MARNFKRPNSDKNTESEKKEKETREKKEEKQYEDSNSDFDILSSNYAAFVKYFTRNDEYIKKTYATKHHTKLENLGLELKMLMKICKLSAGEEECNVLYEEITQELKCLGDSTLPGCTDYNE